jgi:isopenicillin-N N-acyltransferase like protein
MPSFPVNLAGDAYARGRGQAAACPDTAPAVRAMVAKAEAKRHAAYLQRQWEAMHRLDPAGLAEMRGIAEGFGIGAEALFAFLFAGQLSGVADECSAWACGGTVGKNRDLRGDALAVQRVFLHEDPAWQGRRVLCVGSLGAPGAYSSGINSDGLALADTQVVTRDQGIGLLRYFMMGRLLAECDGVDAALDLLRDVPQAGGGTLVLADATGVMATVEIGHRAMAIERSRGGWVARTNHFLAPVLRNTRVGPGRENSEGRLATLSRWLDGLADPPTMEQATAMMGTHDEGDRVGLCRHGGATEAATVSCHLYGCTTRRLAFARGTPCTGDWFAYNL